jgi:valyl-tRNA synthetase
MEALMAVVTRVRSLKTELQVPPRVSPELVLAGDDADLVAFLEEHRPLLAFLARVGAVSQGPVPDGPASDLVAGVRLGLVLPRLEVGPEERERLQREVEKLEREIAGAEARLANAQFLAKAPPGVVAGNRERLNELRERRARIQAGLAS